MAKKRKSSPELSETSAKKPKTETPERFNSLWKVGAHVSSAGGVENAIINAAEIGANAFALFVKSQRKWSSPPFTENNISKFKENMTKYGYNPRHVLPHGSYLINLGNPDPEKRKKSYDCFLDDLKRCEQLGLELYNFHPGSTVGATTIENSISLIAQGINEAHAETTNVIAVIENMAGTGNIIGSSFNHLASIISQVKNKSRVGVCLDTCHLFAAGYDFRTKEAWEQIIVEFDKTTGLGSNKDRHENIGLGSLGITAFQHILKDPRMQDIPLVLETPSNEKPFVWAKEIEVLHKISGEQEIQSEQELVTEIKAVVKEAEGQSKKKKSSAKKKQE